MVCDNEARHEAHGLASWLIVEMKSGGAKSASYSHEDALGALKKDSAISSLCLLIALFLPSPSNAL